MFPCLPLCRNFSILGENVFIYRPFAHQLSESLFSPVSFFSPHTLYSPTCTTTDIISKHTDEIYFVVILHSTVEHFLFSFFSCYVHSTDTLLMLKVDCSGLFLTSVHNGSCSISVLKSRPVFFSSISSERRRLSVGSDESCCLGESCFSLSA